ncbi:methylated-DNA--[protein]-cysteine S-methyltransferase [Nocardioides daphniae]|uniref:Methylated-DNA--protein-cysteine methyltransferase n=1 Tax=Nocardioides daphniae TaxID=402297 RepID=A0A4P7UB18_9ACTN|nr:methylated-DNA--[protein]-cysteine S-methyltransferase [Nocardioides daphniae]QCC76884.1 methylated-DNA--[protein]-cysteine S-methyltransferase [Nocardioides daphniae]GGD17370.1 methylated-DNA--protein-cysteine methyltransferase [Nocardioides daphniae]
MWTVIESPVGDLRIVSDGEAVTAAYFAPFELAKVSAPLGERDDDHPVLVEAARQLRAYFAGELREFDLPLAPVGTAYQQRVWEALREIPYGETTTYGEIAARLGQPTGAARAVGLANGRNPIALIVPCHRVIGANGRLVGYAGGLERKQVLLDLERPGDSALF